MIRLHPTTAELDPATLRWVAGEHQRERASWLANLDDRRADGTFLLSDDTRRFCRERAVECLRRARRLRTLATKIERFRRQPRG